MAAASRPNLEKATWLGHVQRLRELLDEECSEVQRSLSEHTCGNQWDAEMDSCTFQNTFLLNRCVARTCQFY